jgi:uncharacterized membrane protein
MIAMIGPMKRWRLPVATGLAALGVGVALVFSPIMRPRCREVRGEQTVTISFSQLTRGGADFFCFRDRAGERLRFLLARGIDGKIESAFDACAQCYKFGKGYMVSHGELICRLCGTHYQIRSMRTGKASCVPVQLPNVQTGKTVQVQVSDLEKGRSLF